MGSSDTDVVTNWPLVTFVAVRYTVPLQPVPKLTVVLILPLESVVPLAGLKLTVQLAPPPEAEKLTELPGLPGLVNVAVKVTLPPAVTVDDEVDALAPALPAYASADIAMRAVLMTATLAATASFRIIKERLPSRFLEAGLDLGKKARERVSADAIGVNRLTSHAVTRSQSGALRT